MPRPQAGDFLAPADPRLCAVIGIRRFERRRWFRGRANLNRGEWQRNQHQTVVYIHEKYDVSSELLKRGRVAYRIPCKD
jgi:hypothetical protein